MDYSNQIKNKTSFPYSSVNPISKPILRSKSFLPFAYKSSNIFIRTFSSLNNNFKLNKIKSSWFNFNRSSVIVHSLSNDRSANSNFDDNNNNINNDINNSIDNKSDINPMPSSKSSSKKSSISKKPIRSKSSPNPIDVSKSDTDLTKYADKKTKFVAKKRSDRSRSTSQEYILQSNEDVSVDLNDIIEQFQKLRKEKNYPYELMFYINLPLSGDFLAMLYLKNVLKILSNDGSYKVFKLTDLPGFLFLVDRVKFYLNSIPKDKIDEDNYILLNDFVKNHINSFVSDNQKTFSNRNVKLFLPFLLIGSGFYVRIDRANKGVRLRFKSVEGFAKELESI